LENINKEDYENKSALLILLIFHSKYWKKIESFKITESGGGGGYLCITWMNNHMQMICRWGDLHISQTRHYKLHKWLFRGGDACAHNLRL